VELGWPFAWAGPEPTGTNYFNKSFEENLRTKTDSSSVPLFGLKVGASWFRT
jgi:hypothetical protein